MYNLQVSSYHTGFKWEPIASYPSRKAARAYLTHTFNSLVDDVVKLRTPDALVIHIEDDISAGTGYDLSYRLVEV